MRSLLNSVDYMPELNWSFNALTQVQNLFNDDQQMLFFFVTKVFCSLKAFLNLPSCILADNPVLA